MIIHCLLFQEQLRTQACKETVAMEEDVSLITKKLSFTNARKPMQNSVLSVFLEIRDEL